MTTRTFGFSQSAKRMLWSSDGRKAISSSLAVHMVVAAGIGLSMWDYKVEAPVVAPEPVFTFNVQGKPTDSEEESNIPELAPPTSKSEVLSEPSDDPVAPIAIRKGGSGDQAMVWTPPPPEKVPVGFQSDKGVERSRVLLPTITFDGMGTEPVLVDYEIGRFENADALMEATRLSRNGRIKMTVQVDETGNPVGCSTVDTSGSNILDNLGCGLIMTYRYEPALDNQERPKASVIFEVLEWSSDIADQNLDGFADFGPVRPSSNLDIDQDGIADEALVDVKPREAGERGST